jgi:hypothetical protein
VASFQSTAVSAFVDGGLSTAQSLSVGLAGVSGSLNVGEFAGTATSLSTVSLLIHGKSDALNTVAMIANWGPQIRLASVMNPALSGSVVPPSYIEL